MKIREGIFDVKNDFIVIIGRKNEEFVDSEDGEGNLEQDLPSKREEQVKNAKVALNRETADVDAEEPRESEYGDR